MTVRDTGLRFWLRYVEAAGGLAETGADSAVAVLPALLQQQFDLPDEVAVTGDPDVAREDGAILLAAGHPVLGLAAESALAEGDGGVLAVPAPTSAPLQREVLLAKAREQFPVDHGRIDATDAPRRGVRPVLRVGALISYTVSDEDHFQERAECWMDVPSRLELPAAVSEKLAQLEPTVWQGARQDHYLRGATAEAHRLIEAAATRRQLALSTQVGLAYQRERERTRAYYAEQLASIERRRSTAKPDRHAMLEARADATRTEQQRRLAEIDEKYQARHEVRPYRLHLISVPVQRLPVDVRRGDRRYPLVLDWLAPTGTFASIRCPGCGECAPLVAGKAALGCARCMGGPPPITTVPAPPAAPAKPTPTCTATARSKATAQPSPSAEATPATRSIPTRDGKPTPAHSPAQLRKLGEKLGYHWWETAASGNRRIARMCAPNSPAAALIRLYGAAGSDRAVGLAFDEVPRKLTATGAPSTQQTWHATIGIVDTGRATYDYLLRWRMGGGTPLVEEVLPYGSPVGARLPWVFSPAVARMRRGLPDPRGKLDPVAAALWERALPRHGLPVTLRCLAAWWRIGDGDDLLEGHPAAVLAAAVERMVGQRANNTGGRYAEVALAYGMPEPAIRDAGALLQRRLTLSPTQWW
ncbi:MAG: hypothetical protein ACRDRN_07905 [Sciscionella sp.]